MTSVTIAEIILNWINDPVVMDYEKNLELTHGRESVQWHRKMMIQHLVTMNSIQEKTTNPAISK